MFQRFEHKIDDEIKLNVEGLPEYAQRERESLSLLLVMLLGSLKRVKTEETRRKVIAYWKDEFNFVMLKTMVMFLTGGENDDKQDKSYP